MTYIEPQLDFDIKSLSASEHYQRVAEDPSLLAHGRLGFQLSPISRSVRYSINQIEQLSPSVKIYHTGKAPFSLKLVNVSNDGIRVEGNKKLSMLSVGDVIRDMEFLFDNKPVFRTHAEIRHASLNAKGRLEYGLKLLGKTFDANTWLAFQQQVSQEKQLPKAMPKVYRAARYGTEILNHLEVESEFSLGDRYVSSRLINFSEFGLRFRLDPAEFADCFETGQIVEGLVIKVNGEVAFSGKVRVAHIVRSPTLVEIGVFCLEKPFPIAVFFNALQLEELNKKFLSSVTSVQPMESEMVPVAFKEAVYHLQNLLETMKAYFNDVEQEINDRDGLSPEDRLDLQGKIIRFSEQTLGEKMQSLILDMGNLVSNFPEERHVHCRTYFQARLIPFMKASAICRRSLERPLGYAGDYQMINIICNERLEGATLWEKAFNYFITGFPPAKAVRERAFYLKGQILDTLEYASSQSLTANIMSVACGPCQELQYALSEADKRYEANFYLIDQEEQAFNFSMKKLYSIIQKQISNIRLVNMKQSVKNLLKNPDAVSSEYPKMQLIYVVGLYDYLSPPVAQKLTGILLNMLAKDGKLIIGNFGVNHRFKFFIEYALDWFLIHRSTEEMMQFLPSGQTYKAVNVLELENGSNLFLEVQI